MVGSGGENALNREPSCFIKLKHTDFYLFFPPLETKHIIHRLQRHESVLKYSAQKEASACLIFWKRFSAHTQLQKKTKINTAASIIHTFSNNLLKSSKFSLYAHYH